MTRWLHLEPFSGAAGDMFLGLLVDLGLDPQVLARLPARLGLDGVEVRAQAEDRGPLAATHVRVIVRGHEEPPAAPVAPGSDAPAPADAPGHGEHERNRSEMLAVLDRAALPGPAAAHARRAVELLFEAEARVHRRPPDELHLHEAGADDALVDIAGTCLGLHELGIAGVSCAVPLPVGGGTIRSAHGVLPVPAPAVVELLRDIPVAGGPVARELITPTGAALLRAVVDEFRALPPMRVERAGHGAGTRRDPALPNVLRGLVGVAADSSPLERAVAVIETQLDDLVPQDVPVLIERLLEAGARDAFVANVLMKKGRPGLLLAVVCDRERARGLAELLLHETPTLGVRVRHESRLEWARDTVSVDTPWGPVRIKRALDREGRVVRGWPEFEDCRRAAGAAGVSVDEVR
nr:nickel pincer cofactor biosynthesis protein LarC [Acidobacteriota bacterium]